MRNELEAAKVEIGELKLVIEAQDHRIAELEETPANSRAEAIGAAFNKLDKAVQKQPLAGSSDNLFLHNDWRGWWKKVFTPALDDLRALLQQEGEK